MTQINLDYKTVEQLATLGLQKHEAIIYMALLEVGQGTVSEISKAAQLNRTTGYDILERLSLYGLANRTTLGNKKTMYIAEPPYRLKQYLENKKHQAENGYGCNGKFLLAEDHKISFLLKKVYLLLRANAVPRICVAISSLITLK